MIERNLGDVPRVAVGFSKLVAPVNRLFDWLYHSKYNPLYRSGTLVVGCLFILLASGTYLLFFYSVAQPYDSMTSINTEVWLGRFMRTLHRYATDVALVATVFHIVQLLAQGKTWGPRLLAWLSGVVLLGAIMLSSWSGYVMVWDVQAQLLAIEGSRMLAVMFPFLYDVLAQAFNGTTPLAASFFFMNLFLHVALPLLMVFGLWVHTSRLARTRWFPNRIMFWGSFAALVLTALIWPVPLLPEADLFRMLGVVHADWFYAFWIPLSVGYSPAIALGLMTFLTVLCLSFPWWWRPRTVTVRPRSEVNAERCSGCTQCMHDCPYDAITMVPAATGKRLLAEVNPGSCVSCGICSASCDDLAIGPPGRTGSDQLNDVQEFCDRQNMVNNGNALVAVTCIANGMVGDQLARYASSHQDIAVYTVDCCGAVHSGVLERLLTRFGGVFIIGCPARNCRNRDGLDILAQRVYEKRVPFLDRSIDRRRVFVTANSDREDSEFLAAITQFHKRLEGDLSSAVELESRWQVVSRLLRTTLATALIMMAIAALNQLPLGTEPKAAMLRIGARVPSYAKEKCRVPTVEEVAATPFHMRTPQICETRLLNYRVKVIVDGEDIYQGGLASPAGRTDRPLLVDWDFLVSPGLRKVTIEFEPTDLMLREQFGLYYSEDIAFVVGKIYLITYSNEAKKLAAAHPE